MRCPRCGNENSDENRFCGMCGGTLLPPSHAPARVAAQRPTMVSTPAAPAPSAAPAPQISQRSAAPVTEASPVISGPSFLGLNDPGPRKRASLSIDPHAAPSSNNLDYLLEDEEEPKSGGAGKFVLIGVALALALGLGYLRWKNHGFPSLGSGAIKPSAAAPTSESSDTAASPLPASGAASSAPTSASSQPAASPGSSTDNAIPGGTGSVPAGAPTVSTAPAPAAAAPTMRSATRTAPPAPASSSSTSSGRGAVNPAPDTASSSATSHGADSPDAAAPAAAVPAPVVPSASVPAAVSPKPNPAVQRPSKPHAAIQPVKPVDRVAEAQKYLYGRGVTQDCERGMRLLKPAVDQGNPAAMVEMGALYSAGLCTPHDLPTAYRWFALALRKDPDDMAVQTDLQKLWGEMTQPERQLAIKMSQ